MNTTSQFHTVLNQSNALYVTEDLNDAISGYNLAVELSKQQDISPKDKSIAYSSRAQCLLKLNDYIAALSDCEQAITMDPSNTKAHERKGIALFNLIIHDPCSSNFSADYSNALQSFTKCTQLDPSNISAKQWLDKTHQQLGATLPDQSQQQKELGNTAFAKKDYHKAIEHYSNAIELSPTNSVYFLNRATSYARLGNHGKSLEDANKSIELDTKYVKAYYRKGEAEMALGLHGDALNTFEIALQLDPTNADLTKSVAEIHFNLRYGDILPGIVTSKVSVKKIFEVVYKNLELLQSESFAKDATAMTLNVSCDTLRCMRSVIIDENANILFTRIPERPAPLLSQEESAILNKVAAGYWNLATIFVDVKREEQRWVLQNSPPNGKVPSHPCSVLQTSILKLISEEATRAKIHNMFINKVLFK